MPLVPTPTRLKLLHACDQYHSSWVFTPLTSWHCKFRPNTEGRLHTPHLNFSHAVFKEFVDGTLATIPNDKQIRFVDVEDVAAVHVAARCSFIQCPSSSSSSSLHSSHLFDKNFALKDATSSCTIAVVATQLACTCTCDPIPCIADIHFLTGVPILQVAPLQVMEQLLLLTLNSAAYPELCHRKRQAMEQLPIPLLNSKDVSRGSSRVTSGGRYLAVSATWHLQKMCDFLRELAPHLSGNIPSTLTDATAPAWCSRVLTRIGSSRWC
jgi:hypothetical protein